MTRQFLQSAGYIVFGAILICSVAPVFAQQGAGEPKSAEEPSVLKRPPVAAHRSSARRSSRRLTFARAAWLQCLRKVARAA